VASALERAALALDGREILNEAQPGARHFLVDSALFETALANVLENAGKYSPPGSTVYVRLGEEHSMGWVDVLDEGPGFDRPTEALFEKFVRGVEGDGRPAGTGLGLSIAESFMEAQGGRIEAANREAGVGARVRLVAPLASVASA
jgi:K+-sensing histidine kinase KdpD